MGLIWDLEDKKLDESKYIKEIQSTPSEKWILASQASWSKTKRLDGLGNQYMTCGISNKFYPVADFAQFVEKKKPD